MAKIVSIEHVGKVQTYDLEVEHPDHQYYLENGLLTSNSHATAYSVTSYQSAWLLTHYPDEWITSYIDYSATEKGKVAGKEDPKSIAITEALQLGYKLGKPDINWSETGYSVRHDSNGNKYLIPSFRSLKGIGSSATEEVIRYRNKGEKYDTIYSLMLTKDGNWKHSKFNKKAMSALVRIGGFDSLELIGPDKLLKNYKQLHYVVVENADQVKKLYNKKSITVAEAFQKIDELVAQAQSIEDWTQEEKSAFQEEVIGSQDFGLSLSEDLVAALESKGIKSIDEYETGKNKIFWFLVKKSKVVSGKQNPSKKFLSVTAVGNNNQPHNVMFWNAFCKRLPKEGDIMICQLKAGDRGFSSNDNIDSALVTSNSETEA